MTSLIPTSKLRPGPFRCALLTLVCCAWCIGIGRVDAQALYFPPLSGDSWDTVSPSSLGWNGAAIDTLTAFLSANNTRAFILLKDGKIAIEHYFGTFTRDSAWYWASAGKSLTAVLVGIAQQEGLCRISDTTSHWLGTGWTSMSPAQEERITILHQLTMTTGLDDGVADPDCTDKSCLVYLADPGTRWAYHTAPYTLLDSVLRIATNVTPNLFFLTRVAAKTGMTGAFVRSGYNHVFASTPRSMARFGLLILNRGFWDTTAVLADTAYFAAMTASSQSLNPSYGYLWWLNGKTSVMLPQSPIVFSGPLNRSAPGDMIAALGKNGQCIDVVPSMGIVFVRMGDAPDSSLVPIKLNDEIWKRLNQVFTTTGMRGRQPVAAGGFELMQNLPNPFNSSTDISYELSAVSPVTLRVFDLLGREIKTLAEGVRLPGPHTVRFDGGELASGVYFYRLEAGGFRRTKKLILLR